MKKENKNKYFFFMLLSCILISSCSSNNSLDKFKKNEDSYVNTTKIDNELVLYSIMDDTQNKVLLDGFNKKYPDIKVNIISGNTNDILTKIKTEKDNPNGDAVWGGLSDTDGDKYKDYFENWVSDYSTNSIDGYNITNGLYSMDHISPVVFSVNKKIESELGIRISTYEDLLNPLLKKKIIMSDPNISTSGWNNICNIMSVFGTDDRESWEYFESLIPNIVITSNSNDCFEKVKSGEYIVGLTYEDGAIDLYSDDTSNYYEIRYPKNGTSASAYGLAIIKNCKHKEAAKSLIDYVCSVDGSTYLAQKLKTIRMTNKDTIYSKMLIPNYNDINWVNRNTPYLLEHKKSILEHFNDLLDSLK